MKNDVLRQIVPSQMLEKAIRFNSTVLHFKKLQTPKVRYGQIPHIPCLNKVNYCP